MTTKQPALNKASFEKKMEECKPSKREMNYVVMDYLVKEGYPAAAQQFAIETGYSPVDLDDIQKRVDIRLAIHEGKIEEAINQIINLDCFLLDNNHILHFELLQLQLIEIIRGIIDKPNPDIDSFRPALEFATTELAPRAPTDPIFQSALERTMALLIFPKDRMVAEFKNLLDLKLRQRVADKVNTAILESRGERPTANIRQLVRARAWAEAEARKEKVDLPANLDLSLGLDDAERKAAEDDEAMIT